MKTLRSRVLLGTTAAVVVVGLLAGWTLYRLVERALVSEVDRALTEKARVLAATVVQFDGKLALEFTELDLDQVVNREAGGFLQLWASGQRLYQFAGDEDPGFEPGKTTAEATSDWIELSNGQPGRALVLNFQPLFDDEEADEEFDPEDVHAETGKERAHLVLVLAQDASDVERVLATLQALLAGVGLVTLVTTGLVLIGVVRRSLRPVTAVSESVAAIGEDSLATRLDPSGVPGELLPVVQRVNELLERLEAAFERERAFSNDVAHELRTPLAGLRTTLEVTARRRRSGAEYAEALAEGATIAGQLQGMVERLLQLARLDAGRPAIDSEHYVLSDLAVEAWEPFAAHAQARGLRVDLNMENGVEVSSDRELVELILRNLYENAVTYADEGGEVRIATHRANGQAVALEVWNTGSRLNQEQVGAATQRFWRGDTARTDAGLHCGLGLSLVEKATDALEGKVELRAQADGEFGVEVTLPG